MHSKKLYLLFPFILLILSSFLGATVYQNGDNNRTDNWTVYNKGKQYLKMHL